MQRDQAADRTAMSLVRMNVSCGKLSGMKIFASSCGKVKRTAENMAFAAPRTPKANHRQGAGVRPEGADPGFTPLVFLDICGGLADIAFAKLFGAAIIVPFFFGICRAPSALLPADLFPALA